MTGSFPSAVRRRWRPDARSVFRMGRRTIVESLYLLTAPVTAAAGLLLVLAGLCAGAVGLLLPGGSPIVAGALAPVRWSAGIERWRIAKVLPPAAGTDGAGRRRGPEETAAASGPGLWLGVAHSVVMLPVALVTSVTTVLWWFAGLGGGTSALRNLYSSAGRMEPMTLTVGDARSHIALSLGLTSPAERLAFGTAVGLLLLSTLPLATRACVAVHAGLGRALLSGASASRRRTSGPERERGASRAQAAAVAAEATALRRLERDIHDGPQQRLVRLAMELGRAQYHFDSRPEAVRSALADAIVQTEEALEELRALSRGIAPPILADRGLRAALTALAARSTVPVDLDAGPLDRRPAAAVETAAYFVVAEALTNVAKHSRADRCTIGLRHGEGTLRVWVTDDGVGGAALDKGHGLRGLEDRLHAAGGRLRITSPRGGPTTITAELPCR
ncbi:sensor histidine kinase [Planomonospora venezuelensis]|uniref:histidine kinase n=1 Tax=Planomonospora venezuelensis TaxID=1999 RepID=A0A841D3L2_PLAVE|nr:sensor domain-containing protein [Planomonospora venezuelensis]MBB5963543.1 signal transduction histidine kinase [Planomonospora venezuelensis]GIN02062.1 histidine kinase [Planomonospora venezuelensis]